MIVFVPTQKNWIGEISLQVDWSYNPVELKGKRSKLCAVINPLVDPEVQEFESEEEIGTPAVVLLEIIRDAFERLRCMDSKLRLKFFRGVIKQTCIGLQQTFLK